MSFAIACAVVRYASQQSLGRRIPDDEVEAAVRSVMWEPAYVPVRRLT